MASNGDPPIPAKKRRVQRACDVCRHKRTACDGLRTLDKKCSNCIESGVPCTFTGNVAKRRNYVDALEARLESTEGLLRKLAGPSKESPASSTPASTGESPQGISNWSSDSPVIMHTRDVPPISGSVGPGVMLAALNLRSMNTPAPEPQGDDLAHLDLIRDIAAISLTQFSNGFQGKSSGAMLVKAAVQLREGYEEKDVPWSSRRIRYWTYDPAKHRVPHAGPFIFPDPDLLSALINLYFSRKNLYSPILHRPTFERSIADGLHTRDVTFGSVVLLVCAIASRYSDDIRLQQETEPLRRGWQFFDQITHSEHIFQTTTIYHLQYYCLAASFLAYSSPSTCWALIGMGLRLALDVGAHRQREGRPTVESELWKRGFWVLVSLDRQISLAYGRPCTTQYEDIDADLLIECDDEFWENEDPARAFVQPADKPSLSTFFNCYLRLNNIFAVGLKMLYSLNKTKRLLSYRDQAWEEHIIAELDSALNGWIDRIPPHLRWDPNRPEDAFFDQSALLYCSYYQVQMTIHRPFIPMIRNAPPTSLPSLGICTNAARSCSHIAETSRLRKKGVPVPEILPSVFTSGLILLLNVWSGKRTGLPPHMNSALTEVHKCMATIRVCEKMWQSAGLCYDLLDELATIGQLPLPVDSTPSPESAPLNPSKRTREDDDQSEYPPIPAPPVPHPPTGNIHPGSASAANTPHQFGSLPTYTADLGSLPVFRQSPPAPSQSLSSWYPTQSATPFGRPDFATGVQLPDGGVDGAFNMDHLFASDVGASEPALAMGGMSSAMQAMWANAPTNFQVDDWGAYFSVMSELSEGLESHYIWDNLVADSKGKGRHSFRSPVYG
ncbi:fungal-specific transcription factor domain-containing protein [Mycena sanguinolenta]|nr:fungal-specific transcription factor domain-containing protein [Mycena sanguinolenta]